MALRLPLDCVEFDTAVAGYAWRNGVTRVRLLAGAVLLLASATAWSGAMAQASPSPVEVFKSDGSLQCISRSGIGLDQMAKELTGAGIPVLAMRKANDGLFRIAVCGAGTGSINVFQIDAAALERAKAMGFTVMAQTRNP